MARLATAGGLALATYFALWSYGESAQDYVSLIFIFPLAAYFGLPKFLPPLRDGFYLHDVAPFEVDWLELDAFARTATTDEYKSMLELIRKESPPELPGYRIVVSTMKIEQPGKAFEFRKRGPSGVKTMVAWLDPPNAPPITICKLKRLEDMESPVRWWVKLSVWLGSHCLWAIQPTGANFAD